jgi:hypothetical protein
VNIFQFTKRVSYLASFEKSVFDTEFSLKALGLSRLGSCFKWREGFAVTSEMLPNPHFAASLGC